MTPYSRIGTPQRASARWLKKHGSTGLCAARHAGAPTPAARCTSPPIRGHEDCHFPDVTTVIFPSFYSPQPRPGSLEQPEKVPLVREILHNVADLLAKLAAADGLPGERHQEGEVVQPKPFSSLLIDRPGRHFIEGKIPFGAGSQPLLRRGRRRELSDLDRELVRLFVETALALRHLVVEPKHGHEEGKQLERNSEH